MSRSLPERQLAAMFLSYISLCRDRVPGCVGWRHLSLLLLGVSGGRRESEASESLRTGLGFPLPSAGLEDRPSSGSWGSSDQNSSSFDPSRVRHLCKAQVPGFPSLWDSCLTRTPTLPVSPRLTVKAPTLVTRTAACLPPRS